jgi:AraC-like DNA-binding protein
MIVLSINHTDYRLLLQDLATVLRIPYNGDDYVNIPDHAGSGTLKALKLFNELNVLLVNAVFNEALVYKRPQSETRYYVLHFEDVYIKGTTKSLIDDELLQKTNTHHAYARLTSNVFSFSEELPPGISIKSVKILFEEKWLQKYLGLSADTSVLQKYLSLKTESFDIEPLDAEYLKLIEEIYSVPQDDPLQNIYLQNRVALLVERFFTRIHEKADLVGGVFKLTDDEMQRLIKVEQSLIKDFSEAPPTIEAFSKMVSMSSTKLKKSFKEMYGNSIYSYYQKLRMQKARELILSGQHTIRQTAEAVGYINTANFITAFKKQYNILPGQLLEKLNKQFS